MNFADWNNNRQMGSFLSQRCNALAGISHVVLFDVHFGCLFMAEDLFARTKSGCHQWLQNYCICIICDCVPRNFCPTYEREFCLSFFSNLTVFLLLPSQALPSFLFLFKELYQESLCTWSLFLDPLAATRGTSSELEATPSFPFSLTANSISFSDLPFLLVNTQYLWRRK